LLAEYIFVNALELWKSVKEHERKLARIGIYFVGFSLFGAAATWIATLAFSSSHQKLSNIVSANISTGGVSLDLPRVAYVNETYQVVLFVGVPGSSSQERQAQANNTLIRLGSSGLQIDPSEPQNIIVFAGATVGQVQWTLRPAATGRFPLSISSKAANPLIGSIPILEAHELQVERRFWDYVKDTWPLVSGFFGAFLTLPGILSFWKQWREDRQSKKGKGQSVSTARPEYAAERTTLPIEDREKKPEEEKPENRRGRLKSHGSDHLKKRHPG
jgi:hypothetical protein